MSIVLQGYGSGQVVTAGYGAGAVTLDYRVYGNGGAGGPINYAVPIASGGARTWMSGVLAYGSDWRYGVRAVVVGVGLEESNADAVVRVLVDPAGLDVAGRPASPTAIVAAPSLAGTCWVEWSHLGATGYRVWLTVGSSVNFAVAASATVPHRPGGRQRVMLSGLGDGILYSVGVRAYNGQGEDANTFAVPVVGDTLPPGEVDGFSATVVP